MTEREALKEIQAQMEASALEARRADKALRDNRASQELLERQERKGQRATPAIQERQARKAIQALMGRKARPARKARRERLRRQTAYCPPQGLAMWARFPRSTALISGAWRTMKLAQGPMRRLMCAESRRRMWMLPLSRHP